MASLERIRKHSSEESNKKIDRYTIDNIRYYSVQSKEVLNARISELEREWDIERAIEINAALMAFGGTLLSFLNRRWLFVPGLIASFLTQHSVQGWSPPVPILRAMGFRTRQEIDREKYALKMLRGDFDDIYDTADAWRAVRD